MYVDIRCVILVFSSKISIPMSKSVVYFSKISRSFFFLKNRKMADAVFTLVITSSNNSRSNP